MTDKVRAAVVLFVDIDADQVAESNDLAFLVQWGLHQQLGGNELELNVRDKKRTVRIVNVMDAGMAAGNGYLWTQPTQKAWRERGIYTEKEQKQIDAEEKWEQENHGV